MPQNQGLVENLDCKNTAPAYEFKPVYYACFGWKSLPSQFKAEIGPTTTTGPVDCTTLGYPSTKIEITLARQGCSYVWTWSNGQIGFILSSGTPAPLMGGTANMPDISAQMTNGTFWFVQNAISRIGSCSWNQQTNETRFELSGVIREDPGCEYPYRIWYDGV